MELIELLRDENTKIVRAKKENETIMYFVDVVENLSSKLINSFEDFVNELNIPIVLSCYGYEFLLSPGEKIDTLSIMEKQNINDKYYADMLENEAIEKILNGATVENIASELRRIKALPKVTHLYPGLHPYQTVTPSKRLYELYRINQPDAYLDNMVEEAKLLAQQEEGKTLRKIKGEKQICNF